MKLVGTIKKLNRTKSVNPILLIFLIEGANKIQIRDPGCKNLHNKTANLTISREFINEFLIEKQINLII